VNHPHLSSSAKPILTKVLHASEGNQKTSVVVSIFAPVKENELHICSYEIQIGNEIVRSSSVSGGDDVHAMLLALWKIETELKFKPPFDTLGIEHDDVLGFGFIHSKQVWESVYK
jgi:hypothetical protein